MKQILLVLIAAAATACGSSHDATPQAERPAIAVTTETVRTAPLAGTFDAGGSVRSRTVAVLSSRIVAPIVEVRVKAGDYVRNGQPLVRLDERELHATAARGDAALAAARQGAVAASAEQRAAAAAVTLARATHRRITGLRERNSATPAELDDANAMLEAAQAREGGSAARALEAERAADAAEAAARATSVAQSYATIRAPFEGIVTARSVDPGNLATPGMPLVTIEDPKHFRIEVSVDASRAAGIAAGSEVTVAVDGIQGPLDGIVAEVGQSVDPITHMFTVKIDLPAAQGLRSGLFGRARLAGAAVPVQSVPSAAVVRRGQVAIVFVEEKGTARMRLVHTGPEAGGRVPVLAGLSDGEQVIVNPPAGLADGSRVTAARSGGAR